MTDPDRGTAPLVRVATKALTSTRAALEGTTTWLALSDADGRVVYEWSSSDRLRRQLQRADVHAGVDLAIGAAGANGIGLALARRAAAIIHGADHEDERWKGLTCAAGPLLHPVSREVLGAVNVTCLANEANPYLKLALKHVIDEVQTALSRASQARHRRLMEAHLRVKAGTRAAVVTLDRHTVIADGTGPAIGERAAIWALLERAGSGAAEVVLPAGGHARVVLVDPGDVTAGCSLVVGHVDAAAFAQASLRGEMPVADGASLSPLETAEREIIAAVLAACDGNKSDAADRLQISRGTLYERIRRYGL